MGVAVRILTADYSIFQISFTRNFFGFLPILLLLAYSKQMAALKTPFSRHEWMICAMRGGVVSLAQLFLFTAYSKLEFATVATLAFSGPFFVTALSVPLLGARVGFWRWSAVVMGFSGVVMIMQPGASIFSLFSIFPVLAALCYATSSTIVKLFPADRLSGVIQFRSQIFAVLFSLLLWLGFGEFVPILLAPFEYFGIPFSLFLGWWFFAEAPLDRLFPGVLAIVAGGLVIIWRQARAKPDAGA